MNKNKYILVKTNVDFINPQEEATYKDKSREKDKINDNDKEGEDNKMDIDDEESEEPDNKNEKYKKRFTLLDYMWLFNPAAKSEIIFLFNDKQKKSELIKTVNQVRDLRPHSLFGLGLILSANDIFLTINI